MPGTRLLPKISLFAGPRDSVRLVCEEREPGIFELHVSGPAKERGTHRFKNFEMCEEFCANLELKLLAAGFSRVATGERRRT